MSYSVISSRRIPYDVNGSTIGINKKGYQNGINTWLDSTVIGKLNGEANSAQLSLDHTGSRQVWIFLPKKYEIEHFIVSMNNASRIILFDNLQGSNDTTNGIDGTWETAVFPSGTPLYLNTGYAIWRSGLKPVSFSEPKKVLRFSVTHDGKFIGTYNYFHIYGKEASGETQDDILFCDVSGSELTALTDWGDRPEGTTVIKSFKVKNASTTKIANNVNLQLNHADFLMSLSSSGPWVATLDIASIPANSLSAEIFVKNALGPPLLTLGPKAARIIATVGSFT